MEGDAVCCGDLAVVVVVVANRRDRRVHERLDH
jgi:hypothetical protein